MTSKKFLCAICSFLMLCQLHAQTSFEKDSLELLRLTDGIDTYYTNPFVYKNQVRKAFPLVNKMLEQAPESTFLKRKRIQVYRFYQLFIRQELKYDESLKIILKNIENRKELRDTCGLSVSYRALGNFWKSQKNYDKTLPIINQALAIATQCKNGAEMARATMDIARFYFTLKKLDTSLYLNKKALDIATQYKFTGGIANAHYQLSRYYNQKKEFPTSLYHLEKAKSGFEKTKNISALERVNAAYANYYRKNGQPEKAVTYFKKAIDFNLTLRDSSRLMSRFLGLSNSYRALENYKGAYQAYLNYKGLQKKINDKKYYGQLIELEAKLKYAHQKRVDSLQFAKQKQLDESRIKQAANTRFWWFVILLSAVVITILIFYLNSRHKLKEQAYQNILLNEKIATKSEEIQELLQETMKQIKSKEKIATDLQKYSRDEEGITIQNILADLKASKVDDQKLLLIKENVEKINFEFLKLLKAKHADLTKTEIEICSFIKMGFTRKEISQIRGTSDFAVKTSRNRIRKKMNIDPTITLDNYLKSLSS